LPVTEDRPIRRSESEMGEKTLEDALWRGLEAQRTAAAMQAKMPVVIKPRVFRSKL
jgi:hypothetical protein